MEENIKKIDFTIGIFDNITDKIKNKILEESTKCETYAVGVYTDKFIIENLMTYPSKNLEERINLAKNIEGVSFTFPVNTSNKEEVKKIIEEGYQKYLKNK